MLDLPMGNILENIALPDKIKTALKGKDKEFAQLTEIVSSFEKGEWQNTIYKRIGGRPIEKNCQNSILMQLKWLILFSKTLKKYFQP